MKDFKSRVFVLIVTFICTTFVSSAFACQELECPVYLKIDKATQSARLFVHGEEQYNYDFEGYFFKGDLLPDTYLDEVSALEGPWAVSSGVSKGWDAKRGIHRSYETPNYSGNPKGPIYVDQHSSYTYPGGNYIDEDGHKLGNMPFAVMIFGAIGVHGTPKGNYSKLGNKASHGCIRMRTENAFLFNRLVQKYGRAQTWVKIYDSNKEDSESVSWNKEKQFLCENLDLMFANPQIKEEVKKDCQTQGYIE